MDDNVISTDLAKYSEGLTMTIDELIKEFSFNAKSLTIGGIKDVQGYKTVHDYRMRIVRVRNKIEKKRQELKAGSLAYGRAIDGEAKRIFELLKPIEDKLYEMEKAIDDEKEKIRLEEQERKLAELREKVEREQAAKTAAELDRIDAIKKQQEAEAKKLADEREKLEAEKKAFAEKFTEPVLPEAEENKAYHPNTGIEPNPEYIAKITEKKSKLIDKFFVLLANNDKTLPSDHYAYIYGTWYIIRPEYYESNKLILELIIDEVCTW